MHFPRITKVAFSGSGCKWTVAIAGGAENLGNLLARMRSREWTDGKYKIGLDAPENREACFLLQFFFFSFARPFSPQHPSSQFLHNQVQYKKTYTNQTLRISILRKFLRI